MLEDIVFCAWRIRLFCPLHLLLLFRNIKPKQLGKEVSILQQRQAVSHQHRGAPGPGEATVPAVTVRWLGESDNRQDDHQEWRQDWWEQSPVHVPCGGQEPKTQLFSPALWIILASLSYLFWFLGPQSRSYQTCFQQAAVFTKQALITSFEHYLPGTEQQPDTNSDYLLNLVEKLPVKEPDIFLRSWLGPKTELKERDCLRLDRDTSTWSYCYK